MMNKKQIATMATCIAMVGVVAVGGTLALLTTEKKTLTNTFTVGEGFTEPNPGDYQFKLDEAKVEMKADGSYGVVEGPEAGRVVDGQKYSDIAADVKLYKDPTFHLNSDYAPDAWIVAYVGNDEAIAKIEAIGDDWVAVKQDDNDKWVKDKNEKKTTGYFVYNVKMTELKEDTTPIFTSLKANHEFAEGVVPEVEKSVVVKGVAVQAANANVTDLFAEGNENALNEVVTYAVAAINK